MRHKICAWIASRLYNKATELNRRAIAGYSFYPKDTVGYQASMFVSRLGDLYGAVADAISPLPSDYTGHPGDAKY